jgi:recombination protein RecT
MTTTKNNNALVPTSGGGTAAPAKREPPKTIRELINSDVFKAQVERALPKHLTADRFIRIATTALLKTPKLADCTQASVLNCLLSLSALGLEPDGRLAHLVPFENRKARRVDCTLIIDYKGLVELVMRTGRVSNIHADKVCENDVFEYDRGEVKKHTIDLRHPRGDAYAYYCLVRFKDGTERCEVMSKDEVEAVRKLSRAANSGPWVDHFDEMAKKTCFRRCSKWLPHSAELAKAMETDDDRLETIQLARPAKIPTGEQSISLQLPDHGQEIDETTQDPDPEATDAELDPEDTSGGEQGGLFDEGEGLSESDREAKEKGIDPERAALRQTLETMYEESPRLFRQSCKKLAIDASNWHTYPNEAMRRLARLMEDSAGTE